MDVAHWLRQLGLERYEAAFRENDVSAAILSDLTAEDLKELGVVSVGHRRQLLEAIDDAGRDRWLRSQNIRPIHIPNATALRSPHACELIIMAELGL
jgi:SAM domain (Sterile alpha motif)